MAVVRGRVSEGFPDFGAIFMCNKSTKDECFGRGIFGLPLAFANFVNHVKAGMLLFLFEYEGRNLYGVFEATSDGRMNIVPRAYCSSGKTFPAQVCFRVVWKCRPLPEHTFRDAIMDNYYSANKFTFGLSKEQVERLVWLFQSRSIRVEKCPKVKNLKKPSTKSFDKMNVVGAVQTDQNSSSGSGNVELQREVDCKNTPTDSFLLEDYIPLCDPEHSDPAIAVDLQSADSNDGKDQNDYELRHKVKSMYCDTVQERPSVFSRLQYGARAVSQVQEEKVHAKKLDLKSSLSEQEGGEMTYQPHPHPVQTVMKTLEKLHEKWTSQNATPRLNKKKKKKKISVFSRISFLPQVPSMHNVEANKVPCMNNASDGSYTVQAKESAKKRSRQVCILDHGDGKNTVVTIQVNDSPRPVILKPTSPSLDCNQVFGMPFPENQHKKMKLCVQ